MKIELKRCPFCGKIPVVFPTDPLLSWDAWGLVKCMNPKCPAQPSVLDGVKVIGSLGSSDEYKRAAIKRWNRRYEG